jgi:hypothetical protein
MAPLYLGLIADLGILVVGFYRELARALGEFGDMIQEPRRARGTLLGRAATGYRAQSRRVRIEKCRKLPPNG